MPLTPEQYNQLDDQGKLLADIMEAQQRNDWDLADRLRQDLIIPAEALMALKRSRGAQVIKDWNLKTETAEAKYGKDWLNH